jgi:hypothetical protein
MQTIILECIQCQNEFEYTVAEQDYHNRMGFDEPKRCPYCRKRKTKVSNQNHKEGRNRKQFARQKYDEEFEY